MYRLIDSHAHLDELEDLESAIERAKDNGVIAIIAVGSDYRSNNQVLEISAKYKFYVFPALGLHPWSLGEPEIDLESNLHFIEDNIKEAVAIGEIGLDYHKKLIAKADKELQKGVLREVLNLAARYKKPALIHSRYAWRDSFTLVKEAGVEKSVFHWYTGPINVLREFITEGYLASATLAAEYHEEHRRAVKETPLESLMLETDSPVVYRLPAESEHRSEPADIARVLKIVARLKDLEPEIVAQKTTENALQFYEIKNLGE